MVPRWAERAPLYAWQEDVKASVVNAWHIFFRIVGLQGRIDFQGRHEGEPSRAATDPHTVANQVELAMVPR